MLKEGLLDKNKFRQENGFSDYVFPFYGADTMLNTREKAEGKKKGHDNLLRDSYLKIVPVDLYLQFVISDMKGKAGTEIFGE